MQKKELKEIRSESISALEKKVLVLKKEILKENLPSLGGDTRDLKKIRNNRKSISQILTIVKEMRDNSDSKK